MSPAPATRSKRRRPSVEAAVTLTLPLQMIKRWSAGKPSRIRTAWASRWRLTPMEWKSRRTVLENVQALLRAGAVVSEEGTESFAKLRGKMAGLLELSGKVACALRSYTQTQSLWPLN
jgi:hypothetical protein